MRRYFLPFLKGHLGAGLIKRGRKGKKGIIIKEGSNRLHNTFMDRAHCVSVLISNPP